MIDRKFAMLILLILFTVLLMMYLTLSDRYNELILNCILAISSVSFIFPFLICDDKRISLILFRPCIVFLLGYFIVFFQRYFDLSFGLINSDDSLFVSSTLINKSLLISAMGLVGFMIGYYLYKGNTIERIQGVRRYVYRTKKMQYLFWFATLLFLVFKAEGLLKGEYSQEELENQAGGMSNYSSVLYIVIFFSLLSISVCNCITIRRLRFSDFIREFGWFSLCCAILHVVLLIIGGSRSNVLICLSSFIFALFFVMKIKIKFWQIILGVISMAYVMSFVGLTRNADDMSMAEKVSLVEQVKLDKKSIIPTTVELSGSLATFNHSLDYVPENHNFLYGSFYVRNLVSCIPFSARITKYIFDPHWKYHSSAFFVTYIIQGENYTYGNGTSINADLYLNYGVVGVVIGLFILGLIVRKVEMKFFIQSSPKLINIMMCLYLIGYALPYSRNGYLDPVNYVFFSLVLNYFYVQCLKQKVTLIKM